MPSFSCNDCGGQRIGKHPTICRPCLASRSRKWRSENPELARAAVRRYQDANPDRLKANRRRNHVKSTYGITVDQYAEILAAQGGKCAICETTDPRGPGRKFFIDHHHSTKRVRGLLCCHCNFILGYARDRTDVLEMAVAYLKLAEGG